MTSPTTPSLRLTAAVLILMASLLTAAAQQVKADAATDREMTGEPIFSHPMQYTGMVNYEGEMIPSFVYGDFYVFDKLVFKSPAQARKYYKIANNIKKVYPLACEIQATVNRTIAHMDSLPTKKEKDAYLKQQEKELKAEYYPRLKKLTFAQGKLLIKLIYRECNSSSYDILKAFLGPIRAGFWQAFSSIFGASLKKEYNAEGTDRLTERVVRMVEAGQI